MSCNFCRIFVLIFATDFTVRTSNFIVNAKSEETDEVHASCEFNTTQNRKCKFTSGDEFFANETLKCCRYEEGLKSDQFLATREERHFLGDVGPRRLTMFWKGRVRNAHRFRITEEGIYTENETSNGSKIHVTINGSQLNPNIEHVVTIGSIEMGSEYKIFEETNHKMSGFQSNSTVLLAAVRAQRVSSPPRPLSITYTYDWALDCSMLEHTDQFDLTNITPKCVRSNGYGGWTASDCVTIIVGDNSGKLTRVKCTCFNSTIFGVWQEMNFIYEDDAVDTFLIFTPLLLAITCFVLFVSAYLLLKYHKHLNSRRTFIQLSITISFFLEGIMSLCTFTLHFFAERVDKMPEYICEVTMIFTLYFSFTTSCWLLIEGVVLLIKIGLAGYINYESVVSKRNMMKITICAWLLPFIIVATIGGVETKTRDLLHDSQLMQQLSTTYANQTCDNSALRCEYCVVDHRSVSHKTCISAIIISFSLNMLISIYVTHIVWQKSASNSNETYDFARIRTTVRAIVTLSFGLGLPQLVAHIAAFFTYDLVARVIIPQLAITAQGPLVFYFYCKKNTQLIHAIKISLERSSPPGSQ